MVVVKSLVQKMFIRLGGSHSLCGTPNWRLTLLTLTINETDAESKYKNKTLKLGSGTNLKVKKYIVFRNIKKRRSIYKKCNSLPRSRLYLAGSVVSDQFDNILEVERMVSIGKQCLQQRGGDADTARLGFHWPPFNSINHLHLHVIAPQKEMGFIARGIFKENSFWFVSPETVIDGLRNRDH
ncbi:unnamed protein product, partial [Meganyctiphanes norvegica]